MKRISAFLAITLVFGFAPTLVLANASDTYREIARHFAPVIIQRTGSDPKADAITRLDFDGDWNFDNNWENLHKYPTSAYVYYEVIESKAHFFLTYAFFHPRDYSSVCLPYHCHENDLEGALLVVEKSSGKIIQVETQAHNRFHRDTSPTLLDHRAVVESQAGAHGVYPWTGKRPPKSRLFYQYTGHAEDPKGAGEARVGYDLLPMSEMWDRRNEIGEGKMFRETFKHKGKRSIVGEVPYSFAGTKWAHGRAKPPWAWHDRLEPSLPRGDWFFDPASSAFRDKAGILGGPSTADNEYVHNPYLGIVAAE